MNPIRLREKVDKMMLETGGGTVPRNHPLLTLPPGWSFLRIEEDFRKAVIDLAFNEDGRPRSPFSMFVLSWPGDEVCGPGWGYVTADAREFTAYLSVEIMGQRRTIFAKIGKMDASAFALRVLAKSGPGPKDWARMPEGVSGYAVQPVLAMIWYYLAPSMVPVVVEPEHKPGKSAEWTKARRYYSVVHRRHAANRADVPKGATVADKTRQLTAHARRAHLRILRSPKWGKSQGRSVWVRSAWVGPLEWRDAESRQVYRVFDFPKHP